MSGQLHRLRALLRALTLYIEARGKLLQIEAKEAGARVALVLIVALVIVICLFCAWLLVLPALIWLVVDSKGWHWSQVAFGAAGLHLFFGFILLLVLKAQLKKLRPFEETFHQFKHDREWIIDTPTSD